MLGSVSTHYSDGQSGLCLMWIELGCERISVLFHVQVEHLNPSRAPAHIGHRPPPEDHRIWLGPDGGSGQGP